MAAREAAEAERQIAVLAKPESRENESPSKPATRTPVPPLPERPAFPLPNESLFQAWDGGWRGGRVVLDNLAVRTNQRLVAAAVIEAINAEGPIHAERLARLVAAAFEVRKLSLTRITDIAAQVPKSTVTTEDRAIFWPARIAPDQWDGFRGSLDAEARPTEHIALRELANALVAVVEAVGEMSPSQLFGTNRRVFGGKRVTPGVEARMALALAEAVAQGRLQRQGDSIRPTS